MTGFLSITANATDLPLIQEIYDRSPKTNSQEKTTEFTFKEIKRLAESGNSEAMFALAICYLGDARCSEGVLSEDKPAGFSWFKQLADNGNTKAMVNVALGYLGGYGVRQNETEAIKYLRKAASLNDPLAQYHLGMLLRDKKSFFGLIDNSEAKEWLGRSCDNGLEEGCVAYKLFDNEYYFNKLDGYFINHQFRADTPGLTSILSKHLTIY